MQQIANGVIRPPRKPATIRQFRAAWVATMNNIDWPSKPGLPASIQQQEFLRILDTLQQTHMNAIIMQIKPTADAFYPSHYGPWSQYLTGVQGKDPGYNPLAFMIMEAHRRNLEFHAWFNPYRITQHEPLQSLTANHPARQHPDWVIHYGDSLYYNPGEPAARSFIINSALEVVQNYDIDAVHMDDYFYPYPIKGQTFPDEATYQRYGAATFAHIGDWRRDNVNQLIHDLSVKIKQLKPYVKFGISPFGIWRNQTTDPTGSATNGLQNYDDLYADTRTWIREGWLDYIVPQLYWYRGFVPADYDTLVTWWSEEVNGRRVQLYIGQAAYRINSAPGPWSNPDEIPAQLRDNVRFNNVAGSIFFSMKDLLTNQGGITISLQDDLYRYPALIPTMPWLGGRAPKTATLLSAQPERQEIHLRWSAVPGATYYAVYRIEQGQTNTQLEDGRALLTTMRQTADDAPQSFVDTTITPKTTYTYYVMALDRLHHTGPLSNGVQVHSPPIEQQVWSQRDD